MILVTIKHENGTTYWVERFNTEAEADKWIAIEQSRPYWVAGFTVEKLDKSADEQAKIQAAKAEAEAKESARKSKRDSGISKLKALGLTGAELKSLFKDEEIS